LGEVPQVISPFLGRGRGRFLKLSLPSLGGAGGGPSNYLSPPWEGVGEVPQVISPLLGRGRGRFLKLSLPSLGEGRGWVLVFSFTNPSSGRALLENIK